MNIYLIGLMGVGKSTLAWQLGTRLEMPFHDLDIAIAQQTGRTVADIIRQDGEAAFRELERDVLRHFLKKETGIVACGGGTPCFHDNMTAMRKAGTVIHLHIRPDRLAQRLAVQRGDRPLLNGIPDEGLERELERLLDQREPFYRQAHIVWNAANWDVGGLCRQLTAYSR